MVTATLNEWRVFGPLPDAPNDNNGRKAALIGLGRAGTKARESEVRTLLQMFGLTERREAAPGRENLA
jgi:hypothetical protein